MDLFRDVRFAARLLVKDRWFTLMAVVVLALGIGANNAVFTIVNAVLLRNLPLPKADQIMFVGTRDTQGRDLGVSLRDFEDWRPPPERSRACRSSSAASFNVGNEGLTTRPGPRAATSRRTSSGCSACRPCCGRDFTPRRGHARRGAGRADQRHALAAALRRRPGDRGPNHPHRGRARRHHRRHAGGHALSVQRRYLAPDRRDAGRRFTAAATGAGLFCGGPARRRRHGRAVAGRAAGHRQAAGRAVSDDQQGSVAACRSVRRAHTGPADPAAVLVADGRRRVRAADRVLERRQPAARARGSPVAAK